MSCVSLLSFFPVCGSSQTISANYTGITPKTHAIGASLSGGSVRLSSLSVIAETSINAIPSQAQCCNQHQRHTKPQAPIVISPIHLTKDLVRNPTQPHVCQKNLGKQSFLSKKHSLSNLHSYFDLTYVHVLEPTWMSVMVASQDQVEAATLPQGNKADDTNSRHT